MAQLTGGEDYRYIVENITALIDWKLTPGCVFQGVFVA